MAYPNVIIRYTNGSEDSSPMVSMPDAMNYVRNHVSYSGGRVRRVEIETEQGSLRAVWDITWDALSQFKGLLP